MIASAAEVVALTSAEKIGTAAPYIVGPLSDLTHLVTERSVPNEVLAPYRALGITIVRAYDISTGCLNSSISNMKVNGSRHIIPPDSQLGHEIAERLTRSI